MLKVDEVANDLKVSRGTVVSLIKKGKLQAIKVGDQYRIPELSFRSFISNVTIAPPIESKFHDATHGQRGDDMLVDNDKRENDFQT